MAEETSVRLSLMQRVIVVLLLLFLGFFFSIAYNQLHEGRKLGRDSAARLVITTIHHQQSDYENKHGRFGTLAELVQSSSLDPNYAKGLAIDGYIYSISNLSQKTYCIHANRVEDQAGYSDYIICEDGLLRFSDSPTKGSLQRGEGEIWPYPREFSTRQKTLPSP